MESFIRNTAAFLIAESPVLVPTIDRRTECTVRVQVHAGLADLAAGTGIP